MSTVRHQLRLSLNKSPRHPEPPMTLVRSAAAAVALAISAAPALADDKDDRIKKLEDITTELRKEVKELKSGGLPPSDASAIRAAVDDYLARAETGPAAAASG